MGSGSTGAAAIQLGRGFIGCEIVDEVFDLAKMRIREVIEARTRLKEISPLMTNEGAAQDENKM